MSHFARVCEASGLVFEVIVAEQEFIDSGVVDKEGYTWIQCSYNNNFRNIYPGKGYLYLKESPTGIYQDYFIEPKPFDSWKLNEETGRWDSPVEYPTDGKLYDWNEEIKNWIEFVPRITILLKPNWYSILNEFYQWERIDLFFVRKIKNIFKSKKER